MMSWILKVVETGEGGDGERMMLIQREQEYSIFKRILNYDF